MRLSDCFMELIAYTCFLLQNNGVNDVDYERVKADIDRLIVNSRDCAINSGFSQEDYELAKFAVCAWIDERVLESHWSHKHLWQREQLQRRYFNTTNAGEEFFEKMNSLGPHQLDVREVYYLCLCLGFLGRYCQEGDDQLLEQVKMSNLKLLTGSTVSIPSIGQQTLFPEAYPAESFSLSTSKTKRTYPIGKFVALVVPVALFGLLYVIYSFILNGVGNSIMDIMH